MPLVSHQFPRVRQRLSAYQHDERVPEQVGVFSVIEPEADSSRVGRGRQVLGRELVLTSQKNP